MAVNASKPAINLQSELTALNGIATKTEKDLEDAMRDRFIYDTFETKKTATAVDVFIYNTALDSDGGKWRYRCEHTSWYNEELNTATRGSRREFPAVAVIVAETDKVTIYDGDDPSLPMWMVFTIPGILIQANRTFGVSSVKNGQLFVNQAAGVSGAAGMSSVNFVNDGGTWWSNNTDYGGVVNTDIANRNIAVSSVDKSSPAIVNGTVNDIALTILPDAGTDPATGLQYVTAAVATDGGVSVIKNIGSPDESVVDIIKNVGSAIFAHVVFYPGSRLLMSGPVSWLLGIPDTDVSAPTWPAPNSGAVYLGSENYNASVNNYFLGSTTNAKLEVNAFGTSAGLTLLKEKPDDKENAIVSYITSSYNTGYMPGDIKLATLADTDTDSIVGAELVTNGTFDTDLSGWNDPTDGRSTATLVGNALRLTNGATGYAYAYQVITTTVGKKYVAQYSQSNAGASGRISIYNSEGSGLLAYATANTSTGVKTVTFTATQTSHYLTCDIVSASVGVSVDFDNISVREAVEDRSVNNNGLAVYGTITRSAVNTGNDLVAYSGFSATNYLQQPYNSDLDFGTGDFYVMGWVACNGTYETLVSFGEEATPSGWYIQTNATSNFIFYNEQTGIVATSSFTQPGSFVQFCIQRQSGIIYIFESGVLAGSGASTTDYSLSNAVLVVGKKLSAFAGGDDALANGSLSLLRIGAGALTADEIKAIYEAEKPLFEEGAQATLYGSSDAVTALAHDPVTDLLHVGTSSGRSVFKGLQRVDNTITGVTAIDAHNHLVVEG